MNNYQKICALSLMISVLSLNTAFAGTNFNYTTSQPVVNQTFQPYNQPMQYNNNTPLRGSVVTVPAGATFSATLSNELSSQTATAGQPVYMILGSDFYYNEKLIAPAGSTVSGTIVEVKAARRANMNGKLCARFTQISTPMGTVIPISAVINTDDGTGVLVGGTKVDAAKEYTKDVAVGSAAGALSGLVFGALASGDRLGRGVALGTAVGAGGGLVKSMFNKGNDVDVPANSTIELSLTQPITTTSSNYSFEN